MKKEDIEKAAINHINNVLDSTIDCTVINNEEDNYEAGRRDALFDFGSDIFKAGADWRINSVWHDSKDIPKESSAILAIRSDGSTEIVYFINILRWRSLIKRCGFVKWAYIKELIPNKED